MITKANFNELLIFLGFEQVNNIFSKHFDETDCELIVDYQKELIIYPEDKGLKVNERQTCNFSSNENFVVFECVYRLLSKGYKPQHFELEPRWNIGHGASGGRADILIKDNSGKSFLIIECKTFGNEFSIEWKNMLNYGGQLFSYAHQEKSTSYICLYTSDYLDGKGTYTSHIITLNDNLEYLKSIKNALSYAEASNADTLFLVWKNTYKQEYETAGIFEKSISAYEIGKSKYTIEDINPIDNENMQKLYHEFATILRQHNISGRENAFDKLINLFLAKIVDEIQNPDELSFYWKGIAFDDYYSLQDRIQRLYKEGMQKFLGEEVTYIDNNTIKEAFRYFKNDPDATKETILDYFKQLKFYTNNDFAFQDVHNEHLFYQNSIVLLKIVKMLQDIKLKTEEQNQFLGDLFEGFLDQGIKQSEGQYFTPTPIVKFIVSSLPIAQIINKEQSIPNVIDFACGAGHFLNEYATEIRNYLSNEDLQEYFSRIIGIEKEYRLSKVAKVASFMYGQDEIKIVNEDALASNPEIENGTYSVLISNPPYSVKGFLETLDENEYKAYTIFDQIDKKSISKSNVIEAFFVERAKQLLAPNGIAAIILPSTLIEKVNAVYIRTRDIILQYFEIIAIVEFGSGTFGKTGTNTVTLFIKKRIDSPSADDHYRNRINSWFSGNFSKDNVFEDHHYINDYCEYMGYEYDDYLSLLNSSPNQGFYSIGLIDEYLELFEKQQSVKAIKETVRFKKLEKKEQDNEISRRFIKFVQEIEKEKLYYYILAETNNHNVLLIKAPIDSKGKIDKAFLGYEWSSAKGNEGIHYLGTPEVDEDELISVNKGINKLQSPLVNPLNLNDELKINFLIRNNFNNKELIVPDVLKEYVSIMPLVKMLDFSEPIFQKIISTRRKRIVKSKYELFKIGKICPFVVDGSHNPPKGVEHSVHIMLSSRNIVDGQLNFDTPRYLSEADYEVENRRTQVKAGDLLLTIVGAIGRTAIAPSDNICFQRSVCVIKPDTNLARAEYLRYCFEALAPVLVDDAHGVAQKGVYLNQVKRFYVPIPEDLNIQDAAIVACKKVDEEYNNTRMSVEEYRSKITSIFKDMEIVTSIEYQ